MSLAIADGRIATTQAVTRGARRLLRACGYSVISELSLPNQCRADLVALSADGALRIVEVKSCEADLRADSKWRRYLDYCDRFYFAIPLSLDPALLPLDVGLIVADAHDGALLREAPHAKLASASRRAMHIRFAMHAAERYHALAFQDDLRFG